MSYSSRWVVVLGALVVTASCAAGSGTASPPSSPPSTLQRVLRADEIRSAAVGTAYQAVARLRPQWLRPRGVSSVRGSGQVVAYVDGVRLGGAAALEQIQAGTVVEMEYLSGSEATTRFGAGHGDGAIIVRTR